MPESRQDRRPVLRREVIGRLLAAFRVRQGVTQVEVAERALLTQSTVDRLESGRTSLTVETFLDIASALQTTGPFLACVLAALTEDLVADGYEVVASPPRGARRGGELPAPSLAGRVLAGYVTAWLERNRDVPSFSVVGSMDGRHETAQPFPSSYVAVPAVPVAVPQQ